MNKNNLQKVLLKNKNLNYEYKFILPNIQENWSQVIMLTFKNVLGCDFLRKWDYCTLWLPSLSWASKSLQMVTAAMKSRHLLLGRKAMTNLDSVLKSRDITLPTKFHIVKAMVFLVIMYACDSWTIKEGWEPQNSCFQTMVLEKTLESTSWTARRWN